jgi:hypothetical protein
MARAVTDYDGQKYPMFAQISHGLVRGPRRRRALAGLPNVVATVVPHAKLAVHEEFPDQVAATIKKFSLAA